MDGELSRDTPVAELMQVSAITIHCSMRRCQPTGFRRRKISGDEVKAQDPEHGPSEPRGNRASVPHLKMLPQQ